MMGFSICGDCYLTLSSFMLYGAIRIIYFSKVTKALWFKLCIYLFIKGRIHEKNLVDMNKLFTKCKILPSESVWKYAW